jgi:histidine ammonia-lyase
VFQANSSDHNPAVKVGLGPKDSWELASPQMMRFFVKGGAHSHGQHGYIVSNANWDPYPMANRIESFVVALANMDIAVMLRIERFRNAFFTGVAAADVLPDATHGFFDYAPVDLQQEIQSLMNPVAPFGSAIVGTVEDLQTQTRIKTQRARQAVETTFDLLSFDLLEGSLWLDVRKAQDPARKFGAAPTAVWTAFRQQVPLRANSAEPGSPSTSETAARFLKTTPASTYYRGDPPPGAAAEPAGARESLAP